MVYNDFEKNSLTNELTAVQIVSKRSAVIPTLLKDPPLSHKGVDN